MNLSSSKIVSLISVLLFSFLFSSAQKNIEIWNALFENNREQALSLVNKLDEKSDIENLVLKKLVEMENGLLENDFDFISKVSKYEDYENYFLYIRKH